MKKIIFTSLLTLTCVLSLAQETKFGIKGGLNLSNQTDNVMKSITSTNNSMMLGYNLGTFLEFNLSSKLAIQPEILFSYQGNKYTFNDVIRPSFDSPDEYFTYQVSNELYYINIPVMIKYYFIKKVSLEFGPQLGVLLGSKSNFSFSTPSLGNYSNTDKHSYKSIDYGINLGASYHFTKYISTELRYNFGLYNVNNKTSNEIKNRVISISINYKL